MDDIICISDNPSIAMTQLQGQGIKFKNDEHKSPDTFLGSQLQFKRQINTPECWCMSSTKYVNEAIKTLEETLQSKYPNQKTGDKMRLSTSATVPINKHYKAELDTSQFLDVDDTRWYQELIGILRWAVELGRVDIHYEISLLSSHLAAPRIGHLHQVIHVFSYLKKYPKLTLCFDPTYADIDPGRFQKCDWHEFYPEAKEECLPNDPVPLGKPVVITCYVDASHGTNRVNMRSQTGYIIFLNRAPILWHSKRQTTVEGSTFGSEFVALKAATEAIKALRIKLRSFGIPIGGAANVLCDNQSVCSNTSLPHSTLNKKHNMVAYHICREAAAADIIQVAYENTHTNIADLLTKLNTRAIRQRLIDRFMY